jgi:hypothetical protein
MTKPGRPGWARGFWTACHTNRHRPVVLAIVLAVIGLAASAAMAAAQVSNNNSNNQNQGVIIQGTNNGSVTMAPPTPPPDFAVPNALVYGHGDETGVSMTVANISSAYEELHNIRLQFYDGSNQPIQIVETGSNGDISLAGSASAALVFTLAARPQIFQMCTDIVDRSGKTLAAKRMFMKFQSFMPAGVNASGNGSMGNLVEVPHDAAAELERALPCPSERLHSAASCSPGLQAASGTSSRYPSDVPAMEQEAEGIARQKAPDVRLSAILISAPGDEKRLVPRFEFVAQQSSQKVSVVAVGCRFQAIVSDYDGSGWPIFDGPFVDLPTAVAAASEKGFRGVLISADLYAQEGHPQSFLAWHLKGNWAADIGIFYIVTARPVPSDKHLGVWRCEVTSMDGSRYRCSRL